MDVIDEQLEAIEWVQEAGAEPEAGTEVFAQCGTSLVEAAACATGMAAGVACVATGVAIPAIVLFGLLKCLDLGDFLSKAAASNFFNFFRLACPGHCGPPSAGAVVLAFLAGFSTGVAAVLFVGFCIAFWILKASSCP